jgi:predicted negative regulator of RcsB-dependent stress response|tara:strand:- start:133 stop:765 length:633 start_codon:yes stop_codon:yes gene_type:complete
MANFFSASQEEQQEILLTFWQRFKVLIIGAFLAIAVIIVGRDFLISTSNENDFISATLYQQYLETDDESSGNQILDNYPDSIYSDFVRLNEAKKNFINQEIEQAIDLLEAVIANNPSSSVEFNPIRAAAQTRLAKIYLQEEDYEKIISVFGENQVLTSSMYELIGDAENNLGKYSEARTNYMLALQNSTNQASRALINMKISDLEGGEIE